jgi:hypothetical protein
MAKSTFGEDLNFLKQYHKDLIVLENDRSGAAVIILRSKRANKVQCCKCLGINSMTHFPGETRHFPGKRGISPGKFRI